MSDDRIKAVLKRAAEDPGFHDALMEDRASALDACELPPAEKALLMAPTDEQLGKMVEESRKLPWHAVRIGVLGKILLGGAAAATAVALMVPNCMGHSRELTYEMVARGVLNEIVLAEHRYRADHGKYASIEDLERMKLIEIRDGMPYEFRITVDADTFTATARHRTRPDTRRAFQVGPDGQVKPLE